MQSYRDDIFVRYMPFPHILAQIVCNTVHACKSRQLVKKSTTSHLYIDLTQQLCTHNVTLGECYVLYIMIIFIYNTKMIYITKINSHKH